MAVRARFEGGGTTGINGDQNDDSVHDSGAVYVFVGNGQSWQQQVYLKASNAEALDEFGDALSLSADGNTLAVGAGDDSSGTGFEAAQNDNSARSAGAVYVFIRCEGIWQQQAYVNASNTDAGDVFSFGAVSLSADGGLRWLWARAVKTAQRLESTVIRTTILQTMQVQSISIELLHVAD